MLKRIIPVSMLFILATSQLSCKKFLETYSQNKLYASSVTDLNEVLIGQGYWTLQSSLQNDVTSAMRYGNDGSTDYYAPNLQVMDDDAEEMLFGNSSSISAYTSLQIPRNALAGFYRWQKNPLLSLQNVALNDYDWTRFYAHIAVVNTVLDKLGDFTTTADSVLANKVEGEARFLRAVNYFFLVNMYGMPYSTATAASDAGVPLKTTAVVADKFFTRNTVAEVYSLILSDLQRAAVCLNGIAQPSLYKPNQAAVYALLSRVYLYMERYQDAVDAADKVLAAGYVVSDLNNYNAAIGFTYKASPESIFSMGAFTTADIYCEDSPISWAGNFNASFKVSNDLLLAYTSSDLRLKAFFRQTNSNKQTVPNKCPTAAADRTAQIPVSSTFLLRLPEVLLNKAEAQALLNNDAGAKTTLEQLRTKRFAPADYSAVTAAGADLVNFIRNERRRELCYETQRWFDLRRYAVNSKQPYTIAIRHNVYTYDDAAAAVLYSGYYELNPYSQDKSVYLNPIPTNALTFNQGSLTNVERPDRALKN